MNRKENFFIKLKKIVYTLEYKEITIKFPKTKKIHF